MELDFMVWCKGQMNRVLGLELNGLEVRIVNGIKFFKYDNPILLQYTGFKDNNRKKVYHKDIVRIPDDDFTPDNGLSVYKLAVVEWDNLSWTVDGHSILEYEGEIEKIGNVYKDLKLIKNDH